jgi:Icc-related predicted phosphoesterase
MVISCGDLPATYLEFLSDALNRPVYYVLGNHAAELTRQGNRSRVRRPEGAIDIGCKVLRDDSTGLIMAGVPGSPRYGENEPLQYSEWDIYWMMARMTPRLLWNRLRHGRALDVLVTHSPPRDVNDREDVAHRGFKALRTFLRWFKPAYQLHGHVHLYDRSQPYSQQFEGTEVINVFPYRVLNLEPATAAAPATAPAPATAAVPVTAAVATDRLALGAERRPVSGHNA